MKSKLLYKNKVYGFSQYMNITFQDYTLDYYVQLINLNNCCDQKYFFNKYKFFN